MAMQLTSEQLEGYERDGYVVIEGLVAPEMVEALRARAREYTHGGRPLGSVRAQVEPKVARGELQVAHPGDSFRKLEGLVEGDDLFQKLGLHENIVSVIEQIVGPDIKMFRNALMLKPPEVGSAKGMHQDSPYWPIEPMELCSCWFTLDDATPENGCMAVLPGWHKKGPLPHVNVTDDYVVEEGLYDPAQMALVPMKAGGGLFFHSLLPHYTAPNRSKSWRRAIALSYMSARSRHTGEGEGPDYFNVKGQSYPGCVR
ncbi:MAG: phytanoyl-CoA dioxygenase family protein [Armatimonadetes bacterium]|nr:phytanoyl-CoA dioxygenase family protein [Armatimonadota bacterium]